MNFPLGPEVLLLLLQGVTKFHDKGFNGGRRGAGASVRPVLLLLLDMTVSSSNHFRNAPLGACVSTPVKRGAKGTAVSDLAFLSVEAFFKTPLRRLLFLDFFDTGSNVLQIKQTE